MNKQIRKYSSSTRYKKSKYIVHVTILEEGVVLVFNTLTGAIGTCSVHDWDMLQEDYRKLKVDVLESMVNFGVLVVENLDEVEIAKNYYKINNDREVKSFSLIVETGLICNLSCPYCYQLDYRKQEKATVDPKKLVQQSIKLILEKYQSLDEIYIRFIGGEPLMNRPFIDSVITEARGICTLYGIKIFIAIDTNGVLLTEEDVKTFNWFGITLTTRSDHDKLRPNLGGKGTFKQIVKNLRSIAPMLNNMNRKVVFRYNLHKENMDLFNDFLETVKDLKLKNVEVRPALILGYDGSLSINLGNIEDQLKLKMDAMRWSIASGYKVGDFPSPTFTKCPAYGRRQLKIHSDGSVSICDALMNKKTGSIFSYQSLDEIWDVGYSDIDNFSPFNDSECSNCIFIGICGGKYFCKTLPAINQPDPCSLKMSYPIDDFLRFFYFNFGKNDNFVPNGSGCVIG